MTRRVLWITLFATLVAVAASLVEYSETIKVEIVRVTGLGLLAMALARGRELRDRLRSPLDLAVLAWLGVELLATVFSCSPLLSVFGEQEQHEGLLTSLALAGVYLAARLEARGVAAARGTLVVWFAGAAVASVWAFCQATGIVAMDAGVFQLGDVQRPFGTFGHPNLLGVITAAAAVAALAHSLTEHRRRAVYVAATFVLALATAITFSRAAWLALVAGFICVALLAVLSRAIRPLPRAAWIAVGLAVVAVVAAAVISGWSAAFVSRFHDLLVPGGGSGRSRLEIWRAAVAAWRARPLLGFGPDTMGLMSAQYQTPDYWRFEWAGVAFHAHSIVLQTLATRGLVGLLAGVGVAVTLVMALRRALTAGAEAAAVSVAIGGAFVALAVAGQFGAWGVCGALVAMLLAAHAAGLTESPVPAVKAGTRSERRARRPKSPVPSRRAVPLAGVIGIVAALATVLFVANELAASRAIATTMLGLRVTMGRSDERAQEQRAIFVDLAAAAAKRLPWDDHGPRIQATALMQWAENWPEPKPLLDEAEVAARTAVARVPLRAMNHMRLGDVLLHRVREGAAIDASVWDSSYAAAARLWPNSAFVLAGWARARRDATPAPGASGGRSALDPARRLAALYPTSGLAQLVLAEASLGEADTLAARAAIARSATADWHGDSGSRTRVERLRGELAAAGR